MTTDLDRRASSVRRKAAPPIPRWLHLILEVPLEMKLLGANLIIVGVAGLLVFGPVQLQTTRLTDAYIVMVALILGATVNLVLVRLALGPIESLERVARWVSEGRLAERVPSSIVADHELARLSKTINEMLDNLAAGRERVERLGAEVIYAEERQRSQVAQELHDSVGQKLADASFEIAASTNEVTSEARAARLARARELLRAAIEEIRNISGSSHLHFPTGPGLPRAPDARGGAIPPRSNNNVRSTLDVAGGLVPSRRAVALPLTIR
ncbi:MAG TPA: methyl-accepting chemotaxis protein [Gemmatimonadaceae bacterium]|nr:methyl-accepting chemotaxis protein [Gemmatimonadaceae bacterium]